MNKIFKSLNELKNINDDRITVSLNGVIYNANELRNEIKDFPFKADNDTEVIIAAYLRWGVEWINRINGSFTVALFDKKENIFYLSRDRIGSKSIYYQVEGNDVHFAPELKTLMARPDFNKEIRKDMLSHYLFHMYICHPDSIFKDVYKLPPGAYLRMDLSKDKPTYEIKKYWDIAETYHEMRKEPVNNYKQAHSELKNLLKKAVAARMVADAPMGAFLSGGYDSSLTAALTAEAYGKQLKTFSIGFHDEKYNEAIFAKAVATHLGTDHTELYIGEADMFTLVESIPKYYDEPFADSSQIPTMLAAELARRDVAVILSGDGGDELFCGYNIYKSIRQAQYLDFAGGIIHGITNLPGIRKLKIEESLPFSVRIISKNRNPETKVQFGAGSYVPIVEKMVNTDSIASINYPFESRYQVNNWQVRRMLLDIETYLPAVLNKVDRASARYSLDTRCPILDKEVIEYSFRLNHSFKYKNGNKKRILKDITYDYIPHELLDRKKVGFAVPLDKWLRGPLKEQLTDVVNRDFLITQDIFNVDYTIEIIRNYLISGDGGAYTGANYSRVIWPFFVFQKWYEFYIK